jgi:hypothetical protein
MITLGGVVLPNMVFEDEFGNPPVETKTEATLAGNMLVWEQSCGGIPIDLKSGGEGAEWTTRGTMKALFALSSIPNATYILDYNGLVRTVRFRNEDKPAVSAKPVMSRSNPEDTDPYVEIYIKLMEV